MHTKSRPHLATVAALTLIAGLALGCSTAQADERTDAIVAEAQQLASEGDLLRAAELLRRGADEESRSSEDRARLFEEAARQYAAVGRLSLALASAEKALKLVPSEDRRFAVAKLSDAVAQERAARADRPFAGPDAPELVDGVATVTTRRRLTTLGEQRADAEWKALREILTKHGVEPERIKRVEEDFLKRRQRRPSLVELRPGSLRTTWTRSTYPTQPPVDEELAEQLADLQQRLELLRRQGLADGHPEIAALREQLNVLDRRIRAQRNDPRLRGRAPTTLHVESSPFDDYASVTRHLNEAQLEVDRSRALYEEVRQKLEENHPNVLRARDALAVAERNLAHAGRLHANWDTIVEQVNTAELRNQIHRYELRLAELKQTRSFDDAEVQALHDKIDERRAALERAKAAHDRSLVHYVDARTAHAAAEANQRWIEISQARERLSRYREALAKGREAGEDPASLRVIERNAAETEARLAELETAQRRRFPTLPPVARRGATAVDFAEPEEELTEEIEFIEELPIETTSLEFETDSNAELRDRLSRAEKRIEELQIRLEELLRERAGEDR